MRRREIRRALRAESRAAKAQGSGRPGPPALDRRGANDATRFGARLTLLNGSKFVKIEHMPGLFFLLPLPLPAPPPAGEGPREGRVNGGAPAAAAPGGDRAPRR